jgi:hypothetical protein
VSATRSTMKRPRAMVCSWSAENTHLNSSRRCWRDSFGHEFIVDFRLWRSLLWFCFLLFHNTFVLVFPHPVHFPTAERRRIADSYPGNPPGFVSAEINPTKGDDSQSTSRQWRGAALNSGRNIGRRTNRCARNIEVKLRSIRQRHRRERVPIIGWANNIYVINSQGTSVSPIRLIAGTVLQQARALWAR